jgi:hypothetical protein
MEAQASPPVRHPLEIHTQSEIGGGNVGHSAILEGLKKSSEVRAIQIVLHHRLRRSLFCVVDEPSIDEYRDYPE